MTHPHPGDDLPALLGKLERLNQLYAMLSDINRSILRGEVPHELYDAACRIAVESGAFGFAWIGLVEPAGLRLVADAQAGIALSLPEVSLIRDPAEAHLSPSPQQSQDHPRQQEGDDGQAALASQSADRLIPNQPG